MNCFAYSDAEIPVFRCDSRIMLTLRPVVNAPSESRSSFVMKQAC
jgi:hypothetical protein